MSPSGLAKQDKKVAEPMSDGDVADVIAGFAKSATYAKDLGFRGGTRRSCTARTAI